MSEYTNSHYQVCEDGSIYCLYCYHHFSPEEFQEHQDNCKANAERMRPYEELDKNIFIN